MTARNLMHSQWLLLCSILAVTFLVIGCGKDPASTNNTPTTSTLTLNLTAPADLNVDGHPARLAILNEFGDTAAVLAETGEFADGSVQLTLADISSATYQVMVAIRHDSSAFPESGQLQDSDLFWIGLDVAISGSDTISLSQYHWQQYSTQGIVVAVRGIGAAQEGEIAGAGLFTDGYDVLASAQPNALVGSASYVFNGSVVLSFTRGSETGFEPLPTGSYDLWCIVDSDGTPEDWFTQNGGGGIEDGDFVAHSDFAYLGVGQTQWYDKTGDFTLLNAQTLTLNLSIPSELGAEGNSAYLYVYPVFDEPYVVMGEAVVEGTQVPLTVDLLQPGTFQVLVVIDQDNSFSPQAAEYPCLSADDYVWGTLDLTINADMTISISDSAWQHYQGFLYSVKGIPAGNNGKPFAVALYEDGDQPLSVNDDPLFGGVGLIYNNSAMVALHSTGILGDETSIPVGNYDAWTIVDVDGHMSDYVGDSIYRPATAGDQYFKIDIEYTEDNRYGDWQEREGTFLPLIEVYGDISCPPFHGNNIYVYLFRENPFAGEGTDPAVMYVAAEPGPYSIPYFSNDSMYIVAFWDNDGSGEEGGPTAGDLVGAYGVADGGDISTEATHVLTNTLATGNRDFELWMVYSAPTRISKR